jgi:GlcNAc-P-P-Und epimerase
MKCVSASELIAIIGGSGFVGREVIKQLKASGRSVVNIDRVPAIDSDDNTRIADITDLKALQLALQGCTDAIFLAAEWRDDVRPVSRYYDVNVGGARNFGLAAKAVGLNRCIFTSSVSTYGPTTHEVDENHPPAPINHYGQSKLEAEAELVAWAKSIEAASLVIVRPTVIFGPGNRGNVWNLLNQIAYGPFIMIGDGTNRKSMAYVQNIASFLLFQLDAPAGTHIFNYADKPDYDMNALVALIDQEMSKPKRSKFRLWRLFAMAIGRVFDFATLILRRPFGITSERVFKFCANTQYLAQRVHASGFRPLVTLEDALKTTIREEFVNKD